MFNAYENTTANAMYNYIMGVAVTYANVADASNKSKDYKSVYACNQLFNHYRIMARRFA